MITYDLYYIRLKHSYSGMSAFLFYTVFKIMDF